ncbi:MAG: type IV secretion system lytic transglycosylase VirB1 [Mesorhizobium sp.]|uniref:type IV secretion system lytic transglycosylase VirB1 n=1 Tax=unclassified Mesorhizobium TaxID=325217 RepID=UPI000FDC1CA3|nr:MULTISPECIES: type IV secretion system lytic transglycosylase VirB1 [unclassified Mesorhizobium]RWD01468.1 MAG: type IV secretion system lytic transglycosylase VirB1 [Mesorhizobium sp.]RWE19920.1 MAG: type IV secretion system lytic transglycosylase VirB1 [Mesorhizobium sp.]TGQ21276.1 type IV secretion system lytic transglycosylase VirB1 [Mesorhizobium sp. M00.F.Ca.ET.217.01.1.1]TGV84661.1 type IV secretion system lytic transglycosylase VirB1 [Mesorhizobium sp. M00.F.Ca.ET.158.01.1.1]
MFIAVWPLAIALLTSMSLPAAPAPLSPREFHRLSRECAPWVAPSTLAAIAKIESGFETLVAHDNTTGEQLRWINHLEATRGIKDRLEAQHSVDVGLMQINSKNFPMLSLTPEKAFEPCASLSAAGHLLESRYAGGTTAPAQQLALRRAISAYNTGDVTRGFANGYVRKVESAAKDISSHFERMLEPTARDASHLEAPGRKAVPSLLQQSQQANTKQPNQKSWDIWGSYQPNRSGVEPSGPTGRQAAEELETSSPNKLVFD